MTIPVGLCQCGCGGTTSIAKKNDRSRQMIKGKPRRFLPNHHARVTNKPWRKLSASDYEVKDCGYQSPCWIWKRCLKGGGYGQIGINGGFKGAHQAYYEDRYGSVPEGLELDHLCRVRRCVNPDHLEAVTHTENMRRGARTFIPEATIRAIRKSRGTHSELARQFGVSRTHIRDVRTGKARA